ncbi:hypothetical protein [Glaciibacter superstes]|uniref:hypothetical protein n=1 Tax=Glaciibacter superstes TaxID=501023 RepID=UPI0003B42051|nr:hypothetical protein [Glaciibacter superstes]
MRKARERGADAATGTPPRFGVGVQVVVRLDREADPGEGVQDPGGVIIADAAAAGLALYAPTMVREAVWVVQFEEPFYGLDGSGPHETARVPQSRLEAAPEA